MRTDALLGSLLLVSLATGCGSSVEPADGDGASPVDSSVDARVEVDARDDAAVRVPPFVSAPPSTGPYALCGAIGEGTIASLEFDPARNVIALGSYAGFVRLIDADDGHHVGLVFAHGYGLSSLAYSPDRTLLATAGNDFDARSVRLWDASNGAPVRSMPLESDPISVAFVPDGSALIVTQRNAVSRFRVGDGALEWTVRQFEHPIDASAVAPDGSTLAFISGSEIQLVRLRDGVAGARVSDSFQRNRRAIAFSRDASSVIVGYQYYAPDERSPAVIARAIDIATGATRVEIEGLRSVNALRVSPSGDDVAIAFDYQGYERWAIRQGGAWLARAERSAATVISQESRAIAFDRDGTRVALASADAVRLFDAHTADASALRTFDVVAVPQGALGWGGGGSVEIAPDGRELLVGTRGWLYLFSISTQDVIRRFDDALGVGAFSPDQQTLVTGAGAGRLALLGRNDGSRREAATVADLASIRFVDRSQFVAAGRDAVVLHSALDGAVQRRFALTRRQLPAFDLQLSRDFSRVAVSTFGGFGGGIDVFDLASGARTLSVAGNFRSRSNAALLVDGRLLVTQGEGALLATYSAAGERTALAVVGAPPTAVAFSADEQVLLESTNNGTTTVRRGLRGEVVQSLGRIGPSATSLGNTLRISADGALIVRTGGQATLQLWCRR